LGELEEGGFTYKYSNKNAATYSKLGIKGTTYEPGFNEARRILGDLRGKTALDFGSGAGRTAQLLLSMGADKVVGVDHNQGMINQAKKIKDKRLVFVKIDKKIPFEENTFDVVMCAHVFVEVSSFKEMEQISNEVFRVLKPGGVWVIITNNSTAIGREYLSYGYKKKDNLKSGEKIVCTIKKGKNSFEIDDYYWSEEDHKKVLEKVGFRVESMTFPKMTGEGWLDETKVGPHVVIKCVKQENS